MLLQFNKPLPVPLHFNIVVDQTNWQPQRHTKTSTGWTPDRARATFGTWAKSLTPASPDAQALEKYFGIYLFAANVPGPTLYIGIASNDSKASEGVLTRIKKHRVKATGSHTGATPAGTGGVHHPENWRDFAIRRFIALGAPADALEDVRIAVARFNGSAIQSKADLQRFEAAMIANQNSILDSIANKLWPGLNASQVTLLNGTNGGHEMGAIDQIQLW
jgi:hypothetical protein